MKMQEYLVSQKDTGRGSQGLSEFLDAAREMPQVNVKKARPQYVVVEASDEDVRTLRARFGAKYRIDPNEELKMLG